MDPKGGQAPRRRIAVAVSGPVHQLFFSFQLTFGSVVDAGSARSSAVETLEMAKAAVIAKRQMHLNRASF
jgi:hypothetical protein